MTRLVALLGLLLAVLPTALPAANGDKCPAPDGFLDSEGQLPHIAAALKAKQPVKIVVVGGNSTSGKANSRPEAAFPWQMAEELKRRHPDVPIDLVTQVQMGMIAAHGREVLAGTVSKAHPTLVIWQTGTVDAVRGTDVEQFSNALSEGIQVLQNAQADVLLVDPQYSPQTAAMINFLPYRNEVEQVAMTRRAVVFHRHDLMRYWVEQGVFKFAEDKKEAMRDEADRAHGCIGRLLADLIEARAR